MIHRDAADRSARYPDAYQGYLNQVIALNDALGYEFQEVVGKIEGDLARLRESTEFQELVGRFREMVARKPARKGDPYSFHLWNTAGMELIIRGGRRQVSKVAPFDPQELQGPAIIFCNVGVPHDDLPPELKVQAESHTHEPAYFDDSGKILYFDFGLDRFGVRYLNRLETEIRRAYGHQHVDESPLLLSASRRVMRRTTGRPSSYSEIPPATHLRS